MNASVRADSLAAWAAQYALADDDSLAGAEFLLDLMGVAVAGSKREASARIALEDALEAGGVAVATLLLPGAPRAPAEAAAFANGVASHSIEMDDVHNASSLHPGAVVIPAALAVAEERRRSGRDLLEAIAVGYEIVLRVGVAANPTRVYRQGFHPTAVCGGFGAAVAAGKLLNLEREPTRERPGHRLEHGRGQYVVAGRRQHDEAAAGRQCRSLRCSCRPPRRSRCDGTLPCLRAAWLLSKLWRCDGTRRADGASADGS
jgi:2-methylcitrate dehydratase PrpD